MARPFLWSRLTLVSLVLAGTVGCDQVTKQMAVTHLQRGPSHSLLGGLLRLDYAENPGAFLSLFGSLPRPAQFWLLTAGVGAMLLGMLAYLVASRHMARLPSVALALMVGGGLSNWFDRLTNDGRVVDFMVLGLGPVHTGVFNVADVAIMAGAALVLFSARTQEAPPESPSGGPAT